MTGREHIDPIMKCYEKHFKEFKKEVAKMNLKPADRNLTWALVLSEISVAAYREAMDHQIDSDLAFPLDLKK